MTKASSFTKWSSFFLFLLFLYSSVQVVEGIFSPIHFEPKKDSVHSNDLQTRQQDICNRPKKIKSEDAFAILMLLAVQLVAYLCHYILHETHFKYLQEAAVSLIIGCIIGIIIRLVSIDRLQYYITFETEFFYLILLPPIIFESGFNMKRRKFFDNIGSILAFAFIGTAISTFVTGYLMYVISSTGIMSTHLTLMECMLFGALIAATDPVTVLAIFKVLKVDLNLYSNIFGESVLNDAVAIVLYRTIFTFVDQPISFVTVFAGFGQFILIFGGSTFIGICVGLLSSLMFKFAHFYKSPTLETALLAMFAYASYLIAEGANLSGIVAILFVGITMAHYTFNNLSEDSKFLSREFFALMATLADTMVFLSLGMALFAFNGSYDPVCIVIAIIVILFARAVQVFPISFVVNLFRKPEKKISASHQTFIWFAGLRGAIAFTLAIELSESEILVPSLGTGADILFTSTLMISFFSILFLGGITITVLEKLKIPMGVEADPQASTENRNTFYRIDKRFLKPFFTRTKYQYQRADDVELKEGVSHDFQHLPSTNEPKPLPQEPLNEESQQTVQLQVQQPPQAQGIVPLED